MEDPTVQQLPVLKRSPLVRLHINIQEAQEPHAQEVVKAVSKDWETVDVGGFTFRRRIQSAQRQQQSAAQQPAKKQRTLAASPATHTPAALPAPAVQPTSTPSEAWRGSPPEPPQGPQLIPIRPSPAVSGARAQAPPAPAEQAAGTLQPSTAASPQLAPLPADQPQDPQQPAEPLQGHAVGPAQHPQQPADPSQGHADGPAQHPQQLSAAPQQALQMQEHGDSQAACASAQQAGQVLQGLDGSAGPAGKPAQAGAPAGPQGQIDAGLLLELLPSTASQAQRLLMLCHLILQDQVEAAEAAEDAALAQALKHMQASLPEGLQASLASGALQTAPEAVEGSSREQEAVRQLQLERQLASLHQEEQQWQQALRQAEAACQLPGAAANLPQSSPATAAHPQQAAHGSLQQPSEAAQQRAAGETPAAGGTECFGGVAAAQQDAHRRLALQVSSMGALVSQVEELVETAEMSCSMMQAQWHHKKFSRLQHLQSPARLICELVKPRRMVVHTP